MLVSDSHKLVFVHIQKTGGVTVHELLRERIPDLRNILARHEFARRGMAELDDWDEYFKFAFARNPWDRLVSWYTMVTTFDKAGNELWRYVHDNSSTFEEFIHNCTGEVEIRKGVYYSFAYNQLDYVMDEHGNLLVDFIGRLENLDEDIQEVFRRIGLELETVPHHNRSGHRHYSTFYTPETEMIVRERFNRDIEYFGYEFERPLALQHAGPMETVSVDPRQRAHGRVEVNGGTKEPGAEAGPGRTPEDAPPGRPGGLFVCGCDRSATTALADYLNRHPEILVCQERFETTQEGEITLDLSTFERMLDFGPKETGDSAPDNDGDRLIRPHTELLANKDPARLRWIGASSSDYVRRMESVAGNNPGARFIVMYRPIEEVAESWETKDADDHQNSNNGLRQAVKTWNRSLQGTRRFIRDSLVPRVLLIGYHDFLYRTETVLPLISRFLELEFETADLADEALRFERVRSTETLGKEKRSLIQKHANRAAEAWILDRIEKQWEEPGLYTQKTSKAALAASLDEAEARIWQLQQKVSELKRDRVRRRRRFKQLQSSRTWRLLDRISSIRARIAGR
ncbi:MAG: sulfotransferase family 2 domain-containing protein [Rubrobacter sp.]